MFIYTTSARGHNAEGQTDSFIAEAKYYQHLSFQPTMPNQLLQSPQGCVPLLSFQGSWSYLGLEMISSTHEWLG